MIDEKIELIRGSGNVFADFGHSNATVEQLKAILAAGIIGVLDDRDLTVRQASSITGVAAADFSRIRQAKLERFTIDRLMRILEQLDQEVKVRVDMHPREKQQEIQPLMP